MTINALVYAVFSNQRPLLPSQYGNSGGPLVNLVTSSLFIPFQFFKGL